MAANGRQPRKEEPPNSKLGGSFYACIQVAGARGVEPTAPTEWAEPTHLEFVRGYHTPYRLVLLNPVV